MTSLRRMCHMGHMWRAVLMGLMLATLGGCATRQGTVVLLPDSAGKDTAVIVTQGTSEITLTQPFAAATLTSEGPKARASNTQEVQARFGAALAARPLLPARFTLYFIEGKDELTDESQKLVDSVFAEVARRPLPDVMVIGHTDTVGSDAYNDVLSRQRAEVLRSALMARGIGADKVLAIGRGKREPVVATADGVAEARNRRVEVEVR